MLLQETKQQSNPLNDLLGNQRRIEKSLND